MCSARTRPGWIPALVLVLSVHASALGQELENAGSEDKPASADERKEALRLFRDSERAYREGRFDEAARLLERAYELQQEPVLLYNLARAYEGMGELSKAADAYRRFLQLSPDAKDRGAIERRIETLEQQLAERQRLEEEKRRLEEEKKRRARERKPKPVEPRPARSASLWPWVTAGVGVAALGTGAVLGVRSQSRRDDADADPEHRSSRETFRQAETLATAANVLFIVGGVVTAGGVTWIVLDTTSKETATGPTRLEVGVGLGGARVGGRW